MTTLTTTLALIKEHAPCKNGLATLLDYLGEDYPENKEINLLTILESNGIDHFFWAFRAIEQDGDIARRIALQLTVAFAERVLHIYEDKHTEDNRPRKAIDSAKDYLNANTKEKREAAILKATEAAEAALAAESEACAEDMAAALRGSAAEAEAWAAEARAAATAAWAAITASETAQTAEMTANAAIWVAERAAAAVGAVGWAASAAGEEEHNAQKRIIKLFLDA